MPKWEELLTPPRGSREKLERALALPESERSVVIETQPSQSDRHSRHSSVEMSGENAPRSSKRFNFDEINSLLDKPLPAKFVDLESLSPEPSGSRGGKKQKLAPPKPPVKKKPVASPSTSSFAGLSKKLTLDKLQHLLNEGIDHLVQMAEAEANELQETIRDIGRANEEKELRWKADKQKLLEVEGALADKNKEIAELRVTLECLEERIIAEVKRDALKTVLKARMLMVKQAEDEGFTCKKWDVATWKSNLIALDPNYEQAESSAAAGAKGKEKADEGEAVVDMETAEDDGQ